MQVVDEGANGADKVRCRPRYSCSLLRGDPALICWHFSYCSGVPTEALRHVLSLPLHLLLLTAYGGGPNEYAAPYVGGSLLILHHS
jgi:hypothetical protein